MNRPPNTVLTSAWAARAGIGAIRAHVAQPEVGLRHARLVDQQHATALHARQCSRDRQRRRLPSASHRKRLPACRFVSLARMSPTTVTIRRSPPHCCGVVSLQIVQRDRLERLLAALGGTTIRMATKQPRVAVDVDQVARIGVFRRSDRLHRERPCLREFLRVEPRPEQRVCDQLHHEVDVAGQKARSDGEAFGLGARRELAADALDRFGERAPRRACRRPSAAAPRAAPRCHPCRPRHPSSRRAATPAWIRAAYRASPSAPALHRSRAHAARKAGAVTPPLADPCACTGKANANRSVTPAVNTARITAAAPRGVAAPAGARGRRLEYT